MRLCGVKRFHSGLHLPSAMLPVLMFISRVIISGSYMQCHTTRTKKMETNAQIEAPRGGEILYSHSLSYKTLCRIRMLQVHFYFHVIIVLVSTDSRVSILNNNILVY